MAENRISLFQASLRQDGWRGQKQRLYLLRSLQSNKQKDEFQRSLEIISQRNDNRDQITVFKCSIRWCYRIEK